MKDTKKQPEKKPQLNRDLTFENGEHEANAKHVNWELMMLGNPVLTLKKPRKTHD